MAEEKKARTQTMADRASIQYHIGLGPGDLGDYILFCGDPARAERFASAFMDKVELKAAHREYLTFTGNMAGHRVSAMATGIGPDNTEIAVVECCRIKEKPLFIRMGSCGGLQPGVRPGDLVVSLGAVPMENTSRFFVPQGYPAAADPEITAALEASCRELGFDHHRGITATAPGFYGAQARSTETFRALRPGLIDALTRSGVLNFEMESSVLFRLAGIAGLRAGTVCAVYANRTTDDILDEKSRGEAEGRCLAAAAGAVRLLAEKGLKS